MVKRARKNGYSLVEVVIALSVLVVVSITALSIVLSSTVTKTKSINKSEAQSFADNVWECFKAAESESEFLSLVSFAEGITLTDGITDGSGYTVYTYEFEENKFAAQITVRYPDSGYSELAVIILDNKSTSIISFSYRKV